MLESSDKGLNTLPKNSYTRAILFFVQAEAGIRDVAVTGVQTCALPIFRWLKAEGSRVAKGEPLFEVMPDKATLEVEAPASGVLLRILVAEGGTVPVATPIAVIGEPGEAVAAPHSALGVPRSGDRAQPAGAKAEA